MKLFVIVIASVLISACASNQSQSAYQTYQQDNQCSYGKYIMWGLLGSTTLAQHEARKCMN